MEGLSQISRWMPVSGGYCYPDWQSIAGYIEDHFSKEQYHDCWMQVSRMWIDHLCVCCGEGYKAYESSNFLMISKVHERAEKTMQYCEHVLKQIVLTLAGEDVDEDYGKHVLLFFATQEEYYAYISHFYPDGEHPMTGGICLSGEGYVHMAFPAVDILLTPNIFVHELTHACVGREVMPVWLNEALAMRMEEIVCQHSDFALDRDTYQQHQSYWNEQTIQEFWSGKSWSLSNDGFRLSYHLAQVLWRKVEVDLKASRQEIMEFIRTAEYADAGEKAFGSIFDLSLGDLVASFLGDGTWKPIADE